MSADLPPALILSGGAEIVSIALARSLARAGVPHAVLSLAPASVLRGLPTLDGFLDISRHGAEPGRLRDLLLAGITQWQQRWGRRPVLLATEDSGLRCLNEFRDEVLALADFPRARALRMGGLDKAELFEFVAGSQAARWMPATRVLQSPDEIPAAMEQLGGEVVFKPGLKPWDMVLHGMQGKVMLYSPASMRLDAFMRRMRTVWPLSERWVAQSRLRNEGECERGVWSVGDVRRRHGVQFIERWKYPLIGGSGCLVETVADRDLMAAATCLLDCIDHVGLAEVPFLNDEFGHARFLEVNPRAWLQVGLAERSRVQMVLGTLALWAPGGVSAPAPAEPTGATWINAERAALAVLSGAAGPRLPALSRLCGQLWGGKAIWAVYSDGLPGLRRRWLLKMCRKAVTAVLDFIGFRR